ncbi:hypothetical protein BHE74_00045153 [Ensete ventricosum]|nr:hypothetical protein BHE74_00045153 [Ensete ventricosum]
MSADTAVLGVDAYPEINLHNTIFHGLRGGVGGEKKKKVMVVISRNHLREKGLVCLVDQAGETADISLMAFPPWEKDMVQLTPLLCSVVRLSVSPPPSEDRERADKRRGEGAGWLHEPSLPPYPSVRVTWQPPLQRGVLVIRNALRVGGVEVAAGTKACKPRVAVEVYEFLQPVCVPQGVKMRPL